MKEYEKVSNNNSISNSDDCNILTFDKLMKEPD